MNVNNIIYNIVGCVFLEVVSGLLLPEGRMKNFTLMMVGFYLFYVVLCPIIDFVHLI